MTSTTAAATKAYPTKNDLPEAARLEAFRAAVAAMATSPVDLPDGRSYVEALRATDREREEDLERRRR